MTKKKYKNPEFTISKVYTKTGDSGTTSLVGGQKVPKTNLRINAYGEVDELNSVVGICIEELKILKENYKQFDFLIKSLFRIQNDLFNLGTILATNDDIDVLEQDIDKANNDSPNLHSFTLPGGSKINAYLHLARTVCRRCERTSCRLYETEKIDRIATSYLNRLSDAFFVWSRWTEKIMGHKENTWDPNKGSSST